MNIFRKKIKYLLQWTTLYTVGADNRFNPPEIILKSFQKKTWYITNSRKYGFRYFLYFLYFLFFGLITIVAVGDKDFNYKVLVLTGGIYIFLNFFIFLVRFMFMVITKTGEIHNYKLVEKIRFIALTPIILLITWTFSSLIYFAFLIPIFAFIFALLSLILQENYSLLIATTASHSFVNLLQYWSTRRELGRGAGN